jgi:hypothetical protein
VYALGRDGFRGNYHEQNVFYLFIAIEYDKTPTRFFSAWGPETKEQIKLAKY